MHPGYVSFYFGGHVSYILYIQWDKTWGLEFI